MASTDNYADNLGPDQVQHNIGLDLDPNCLTRLRLCMHLSSFTFVILMDDTVLIDHYTFLGVVVVPPL